MDDNKKELPVCAHLKVSCEAIPLGGGRLREYWRCDDCRSAFAPMASIQYSRERNYQLLQAAATIYAAIDEMVGRDKALDIATKDALALLAEIERRSE